ncbi:hypothetical protein MK489_01935 [Myxococcota bacterium]|nr:hypothetical protein [Myxococcota bacterium]
MSWGLSLVLGMAVGAQADFESAELLIRATYYEGIPFDRARALSAEECDHLTELLEADLPRHHENILIALGMAGHPGAYETLAAYGKGWTGELTRAQYQALMARMVGMGHLARRDSRALAWLLDAAAGAGPAPTVRFRVMAGERFERQRRARAVAALSLSGSDEAEVFLQGLLEGNARRSQSSTAPSSASLEAAIAQLRTLRKQGPDAALASPFDRVSSEVGP